MVEPFQLRILAGPTPDQVLPLDGPELVIGRDPTCNLIVNDLEVSRRHAHLTRQPSGFVIEDLGSTNGTFVNGQRIAAVTPLQPGDRLSLGENVILTFELGTKPEGINAAPAPKPPVVVTIPVPLEPQTPPKSIQVPSTPIKLGKSRRSLFSRHRNRLPTIIIVLAITCLCALAAFFIFKFFYEAPPSFWCKALPFVFKPEIYPQCLP